MRRHGSEDPYRRQQKVDLNSYINKCWLININFLWKTNWVLRYDKFSLDVVIWSDYFIFAPYMILFCMSETHLEGRLYIVCVLLILWQLYQMHCKSISVYFLPVIRYSSCSICVKKESDWTQFKTHTKAEVWQIKIFCSLKKTLFLSCLVCHWNPW